MIYTFYSFKGGVGRSMALANVARSFANRGLRVLMVDWDLEAPGLETYFGAASATPIETITGRAGLIDLLHEFQSLHDNLAWPGASSGSVRNSASSESANGSLQTMLDQRLPGIRSYVQLISAANSAGGSLHLLSAGCRKGDHFAHYARAVHDFQWSEFYERYHGEDYFRWLRRKFYEFADVILIDSRTGVTEMGGVCTRQLADVVVAFCAPNVQNLRGIENVVRAFPDSRLNDLRESPLKVLIVPARVDPNDSAQFAQFQSEFKTLMEPYERSGELKRHDAAFWDLWIPYITRFSYSEDVVVGKEGGVEAELAKKYESLAAHMALLAPSDSVVRRKYTSELQQRFPTLAPDVLVTPFSQENDRLRQVLVDQLTPFGHRIDEKPRLAGQITAGDLAMARHWIVVLGSRNQWDNPELRRCWQLARENGVWFRIVSFIGSDEPPIEWLPPEWARDVECIDVHGAKGWSRRLSDALKVSVPAPHSLYSLPPSESSVESGEHAEHGRLRRLLLDANRVSTPVVLAGVPGSGKSRLARAVCDDLHIREAYRGGILWLDMGSLKTLPEQLERIANELANVRGRVDGRRDANSESPRSSWARNGRDAEAAAWEASKTILARLNEQIGREPVLIVLDDVTSSDQLELVRQLSPVRKLLVTTRRRDSVARSVGAELVDVQAPQSVAEQNIARITGDDGPETTVDFSTHDLTDRTREWVDQPAGVARRLLSAWHQRDFKPMTDDELKVAFLPSVSTDRKAEDINFALSSLADLQIANRLTDKWEIHPLAVAQLRKAKGPQAARPARTVEELRKAARDYRSGLYLSLDDAMKLAKELKQANQFGLMRKVAERTLEQFDRGRHSEPAKKRVQLVQQLALATYKDVDLPVLTRLETALMILRTKASLDDSVDPETLGLAGAICKRRWDADGQRSHLEHSLSYYLRGYRAAKPPSGPDDDGWNAINAAFVLDLLEHESQDHPATSGPSGGGTRRESPHESERRSAARQLRQELRDTLPPKAIANGRLAKQWWFYATLAEACFGMGDYVEARRWIVRGQEKTQPPMWELESSARQLVRLARAQAGVGSDLFELSEDARRVIEKLLGEDQRAIRSVLIGKIGLAFSGGGFRASLFHLGVLARLSELDLLRHVEVLSCVSGGSIVGATYYLALRQLLQSKRDDEITREDYVELVRKLIDSFVQGVRSNPRWQVFSSPWSPWRVIFDRSFTLTVRLGELYESIFFRPYWDGGESKANDKATDKRRGDSIPLRDILIHPQGEAEPFNPKQHNWRRSAKVPMLVLNATTMNTGHNWQFTASFMGESPFSIDPRVDSNERLRRLYYYQAPDAHADVSLGCAVAASSCVPGIFEPIVLEGLYPGRVVRLADGGVHDNQGLTALLDQDCNVLFISDACGQLPTEPNPEDAALGVLKRANAVLMERVRTAQHRELDARRRSGTLRGMVVLHLKRDLGVHPLDWIGCQDPADSGASAGVSDSPLTSYGMPREVQLRLANLRTDLDSFCDREAFALMTSGYRMAATEFQRELPQFAHNLVREENGSAETWPFQDADHELIETSQNSQIHKNLLATLEKGRFSILRNWRWNKAGTLIWAILSGLGAVGIMFAWLWLPMETWREDHVRQIIGGVVVFLAVALGYWCRVRLTRFFSCLILMFFSWFVLHWSNRRFLRAGQCRKKENKTVRGRPA